MKQMVQTLQLALDKEKTKVKDLKDQVKQGSRVQSFALHLNLELKFKEQNFHFMLSKGSQSILIGCDNVLCCVVYISWLQQRLRQRTIDVITGQPCWSCQRLKRTCKPKRT